MITFADQLLVLVLLINFISLGTSRLMFSIRAVAAQGVILGVLPGLIHPFSWHLVGITAGIIAIKGFIIPLLLNRAVRSA
jgi:hydrogenase-4 component E